MCKKCKPFSLVCTSKLNGLLWERTLAVKESKGLPSGRNCQVVTRLYLSNLSRLHSVTRVTRYDIQRGYECHYFLILLLFINSSIQRRRRPTIMTNSQLSVTPSISFLFYLP